MVVATKAKPKTAAKAGPGRPRTAKAPTAAWTAAELVFKANGKTIAAERITPKQMATVWNKLHGLMLKSGPGKFTITLETS